MGPFSNKKNKSLTLTDPSNQVNLMNNLFSSKRESIIRKKERKKEGYFVNKIGRAGGTYGQPKIEKRQKHK